MLQTVNSPEPLSLPTCIAPNIKPVVPFYTRFTLFIQKHKLLILLGTVSIIALIGISYCMKDNKQNIQQPSKKQIKQGKPSADASPSVQQNKISGSMSLFNKNLGFDSTNISTTNNNPDKQKKLEEYPLEVEKFKQENPKLIELVNKKLDWDKKPVEQMRYSVNLAWINQKPAPEAPYIFGNAKTEEEISVFLDQAQKWCDANNHENAEINLWYDSRCVTPEALENTQDFISKRFDGKDKRFNLKDVWDIPFVAQNKDFFQESIPVYFRIDILKLIIVLHQITSFGHDSAVYADFSICGNTKEALDRDKLYNLHAMEMLEKIGFVIAKDGDVVPGCMAWWGHKPENQFVQLLNAPHAIEAVRHCINCCMYIAANVINDISNPIDEKLNRNIAAPNLKNLEESVCKMTLGRIQALVLALKCNQPIKIRANIVNEGTDKDWVDYDPMKHNYILFGTLPNIEGDNTPDYSKMFHYKDKRDYTINQIIKLPNTLRKVQSYILQQSIGEYSCEFSDITEELIRNDVNPAKAGSGHTYEGPLPRPLQGENFTPVYWDETTNKFTSQDKEMSKGNFTQRLNNKQNGCAPIL